TNGYFGNITNVLVGPPSVGSAIPTASGPNWFTIPLPAATNTTGGTVSLTVQTSDNGDTILPNAYTYNLSGEIVEKDWTRWEEVEPLTMPMIQPGCGVLNDKLYCIGGNDDTFTPRTNAYVFDGASWTPVAGLPIGIVQQAITTLGGNLYSLGGNDGSVTRSNVWVFDGSSWSDGVTLPIELNDHQAGALDGSIYVLGGVKGQAGTVTYTNMLKLNGSTWEWCGSMEKSVRSGGAQTLSNLIYVVGAVTDGEYATNCYSYNGVATSLSHVPGVNTGYCTWVSGVLDGRIYVAAGALETTASTNAFCFDGVSWTEIPGLPSDRMYAAGGVVNGAFYVAGGIDTSYEICSNVYRYPAIGAGVSPSSGYWTGSCPVVISGTHLGNGTDITNVTLCGIQATINSQTAERVWVTAGAAVTPGMGDVVVHSTSFGATTKSNAFTYTGAGIAVSGSSFGHVLPGSIVTNTFTVTNSGNETLLITAATNDGAGAATFDVSAFANLAVAPGTASNVPVVFSASAIGTFTPTCYVANNSPIPSYTFALTG
ncbi:MAG: DUF1573 domain-containing protein, partial [Spartobacteria bacterium]|nr:DUF1573 domain-containing protein [Spartobacteria bacterium]